MLELEVHVHGVSHHRKAHQGQQQVVEPQKKAAHIRLYSVREQQLCKDIETEFAGDDKQTRGDMEPTWLSQGIDNNLVSGVSA